MDSKFSLTLNSKMRSNSHLPLARTSSTLCSMVISLNLESTTSLSHTSGTMKRPKGISTTKTKKHMIPTKQRITVNTTKLLLRLPVEMQEQPMAREPMLVMTMKCNNIRQNLEQGLNKHQNLSSHHNKRSSRRMFSTMLTIFPRDLTMASTVSPPTKSNPVINNLNKRGTQVLSQRRTKMSFSKRKIRSKQQEVALTSTLVVKISTRLHP